MVRHLIILSLFLALVLIVLPAMIMWEKTIMTGEELFLSETIDAENKSDNITVYEKFESLGGPLVRLYIKDDNEIMEIPLEDYLVGVVAAEMPLSFSPEALKAQAVAARTYTVKKHINNGGTGCLQSDGSADICSDSTHCQAWIDVSNNTEKYARAYRSVSDTVGVVIKKDHEPIIACYHSTCGGRTEDAAALWEGEGPSYLKSTDCDYCGHSPYYLTEKAVHREELAVLTGNSHVIPAALGTGRNVEVEKLTPGQRVSLFRVGNRTYTGAEIRSALGLPSASFRIEEGEEKILFINRGFGHGVGLCQYGADGMAGRGYSYDYIISYYYPGVYLKNIYVN